MKSTNSPSWLNPRLYPFESRYLELPAGRMHYLDEGSGEVLLFVHGTPTWSFLYRDLITDLSRHYRCIAPDHIGFGLSDKPADFEGSPPAHAQNLGRFIQALGLEKVTLIVHDFGGPIGLGAAIQCPEKISRIVLFNTWLWETKNDEAAQKINRLVNSWLGSLLYLNFNLSPRLLLKQGFYDSSKLTKAIHRHYISPFPDKKSRSSLLKIAQALTGSSDWYEAQWQQLSTLHQKRWMIVWGLEDRFLTPDYLEKWKQRLPGAAVHTYESGHFVMEEQAASVAAWIHSFIQEG
jgi:haloalkane dehalogenase